jgi:hypothetical protein
LTLYLFKSGEGEYAWLSLLLAPIPVDNFSNFPGLKKGKGMNLSPPSSAEVEN